MSLATHSHGIATQCSLAFTAAFPSKANLVYRTPSPADAMGVVSFAAGCTVRGHAVATSKTKSAVMAFNGAPLALAW